MSFPKYNGSLTDVDFKTLAKYANHKRFVDVSLAQCADDLDGFGSGTSTNIGLSYQRGYDKADNYTEGSPYVAKARCNVKFFCCSGLAYNTEGGAGYIFSGPGIRPTIGPTLSHNSGTEYADLREISEQKTHLAPLSTFELEELRLWLWAEEDDTEYPSYTQPSPKTDRLMFGEEVGGTQLGQPFGYDFSRGSLSGYELKESGYNDPLAGLMDQSKVYGVPEGLALSRWKLTHDVTGTGLYYVWVGIGYRVGAPGDEGFASEATEFTGFWLGPYTRGAGTTSYTSQHTKTLTDLRDDLPSGEFIIGLEDNFDPDDNIDGNRNYADFEVEIYFTAFAYIPNSSHSPQYGVGSDPGPGLTPL